MIPVTKQAAAIRYLAMSLDPKRLAKTAEAFKRAYHVEFSDAVTEAQRTLDTTQEPT